MNAALILRVSQAMELVIIVRSINDRIVDLLSVAFYCSFVMYEPNILLMSISSMNN